MRHETDFELLQQTLAGDEDAFTALYRRRQSAIYRFGLQMTGSVEAAEDITQETFLTLLARGARYDPARGPLVSFLYGVARNHVWKRLARERPVEPGAGEEPQCPADLLDDLSRRQSIDFIRRAVLSLPPQYREAVVLCDLQEVSYEGAAEALGCPVGTVRSRVSRGRCMLAKKLKGAAANVAGVCHG
jgi:RNA polymerase sigma-70 factor (ECF subfamily)